MASVASAESVNSVINEMELQELQRGPSAMDMLESKWAEGKFLCVGLDVVADEDGSLFEKAKMIVDATKDAAAAYKPNDAFYASLGSGGIAQMEALVGYIKELAPDTLVIWDAKRADIANTNNGYSEQRKQIGAEGITIHPYLGGSAVKPLLSDSSSIGFVLGHTSNPGAEEFQHLRLQSGEELWEHVVTNVAHGNQWEHGAARGLVLGATYPEQLAKARYLAGEDTVFLVPGIGTQGGDLEKSVQGAMNNRGNGFLINVSSGISKATTKKGDVTAYSIRRAAREYHEQIKEVWEEARRNPQPSYAERMFLDFDLRLGKVLLAEDCVKFGDFILKSGKTSPVYMDLRAAITDPDARSDITNIYVDMIVRQEEMRRRKFDLIAGNPQAATAFGTLAADRLHRRLVQPRAGDVKDHGTKKAVEGNFSEGEEVHLVEDLTTTALSVLETKAKLEAAGLDLAGVSALINREQGSNERLRLYNIMYSASSTLVRIVRALGEAGMIEDKKYTETMEYFRAEQAA